jgi:hypothetical protein
MNAIIKAQSAVATIPRLGHDRDRYILYMWLLFLRSPAAPTKAAIIRSRAQGIEPVFDLGDIGDVPDKRFSRATPYSPARRVVD